MSFAKAIRKAHERVSGTKVSALHYLDQQIIADTGTFSMEEVRNATRFFHKAVNADEEDRDKIWKAFLNLYDAMNKPVARKGGVFSPSSFAEDCHRRLFYVITKVEPSNKHAGKPDARLQRIFDTGSFWHWYIQSKLFKAGILIQAEVHVEDLKRKIKGSGDGILLIQGIKYVLEIKTMNSFQFNQLRAPLAKHITQASIYGKTLGIQKIVFLYVNKDTQDIKEYIVEVDEKSVTRAYKVIETVTSHVSIKKAPERSCKDQFTQDATTCIFRNHCFASKK